MSPPNGDPPANFEASVQGSRIVELERLLERLQTEFYHIKKEIQAVQTAEISKLRLKRGDILVVRMESPIDVHDILQDLVPDGVKVVYAPLGVEFEVVRGTPEVP